MSKTLMKVIFSIIIWKIKSIQSSCKLRWVSPLASTTKSFYSTEVKLKALLKCYNAFFVSPVSSTPYLQQWPGTRYNNFPNVTRFGNTSLISDDVDFQRFPDVRFFYVHENITNVTDGFHRLQLANHLGKLHSNVRVL